MKIIIQLSAGTAEKAVCRIGRLRHDPGRGWAEADAGDAGFAASHRHRPNGRLDNGPVQFPRRAAGDRVVVHGNCAISGFTAIEGHDAILAGGYDKTAAISIRRSGRTVSGR